MKKNYREVLFFDAKFVTSSRSFTAPKQISASTLIKHIESLDLKKCRYEVLGGQEVYYIPDWKRVDENTVHLVINKSDKSLSDPTFSNVEEGTRRKVPKKVGEGQDVSAHVVLKPEYYGAGDARALLVMERSAISRTVLVSFFNYLLKQAAKKNENDYFQNHPDGELVNGKPKKYKVSSRLSLNGHLCNDFLKSLDTGKILGIDLITQESTKSAIDQDEFLEEKRTIVEVQVKEGFVGRVSSGVRKLIKERRVNQKFSHMRIRFEDCKGVPHSETLDLDNPQVEEYYTRKERIRDLENLESSYENINDVIISRIESLI
jgi:hypothetical protein